MTTERLPIYVITGFLGSGKTLLLQNLLTSDGFSDTAVIINEFGDVGLDHEMIESVEDSTVVLKGGCVCCSVREDLASTVRRLVEMRRAGSVTQFRRLVVETSGLADPVPVIFTLISDARITEGFVFKGIVATVDGQNGIDTLDRYEESRRQLLYASRAVLTKTDLVQPSDCERTKDCIRRINPAISVIHSDAYGVGTEELLDDLNYDATGSASDWLGTMAESPEAVHSHDYTSLAWSFDHQIDWTAFGVWLTMLLHAHGDRILRIKGIVNVAKANGPIAIHGVQHVVHPPVHLDGAGAAEQPSRIVVIVKGIDPMIVKRSFFVFAGCEAETHDNMTYPELPMGAGRMIAGRPVRRPGAPAWIKG